MIRMRVAALEVSQMSGSENPTDSPAETGADNPLEAAAEDIANVLSAHGVEAAEMVLFDAEKYQTVAWESGDDVSRVGVQMLAWFLRYDELAAVHDSEVDLIVELTQVAEYLERDDRLLRALEQEPTMEELFDRMESTERQEYDGSAGGD